MRLLAEYEKSVKSLIHIEQSPHVNSPGGSVSGSEAILLNLFVQEKQVFL